MNDGTCSSLFFSLPLNWRENKYVTLKGIYVNVEFLNHYNIQETLHKKI